MAELSKGHTYNPGDVVDAADLNNLVDAATALKGIILDQPSAAPVAADDSVLFYDLSATDLARCKISALPSGVTSVSATATPTSVFGISVATPSTTPAIALSLDNQTGNKVLAAPSDGSSNTPGFRALVPADTDHYIDVAAAAINLSLGHAFKKQVTATPFTLNLNNGIEGQVIKVWIQQSGTGSNVIHWNSAGDIRWPGGVEPVVTTGVGRIDIFEFLCTGSDNYYGIRWGADFLL